MALQIIAPGANADRSKAGAEIGYKLVLSLVHRVLCCAAFCSAKKVPPKKCRERKHRKPDLVI